MEKRLSPISALAGAIGALVVSLIFGSGTFTEEVVDRPGSRGGFGSLARTLATPRYSYGSFGTFADKYAFLLIFVLAVGLLVLATARRGTGFVAGWTATISAGAVAGFGRGLLVDDRYGAYGRDWLGSSLSTAGFGASYGLVIGWGVGLLVLIGTLVEGRSASPVGAPGAPGGAPAGGWPEPPAASGPTSPLAWTGGPTADDSWAPAPPAPGGDRPAPPERAPTDPPQPNPSRPEPLGWSRPSDDA